MHLMLGQIVRCGGPDVCMVCMSVGKVTQSAERDGS